MEKIKIALDPGAYMPRRAHEYDAGLDLYAMNDVWLRPQSSEFFDTGVHIAVPRGYTGFVRSRSGLLLKEMKTDGTIDADYTGSIGVTLFNHGKGDYYIKRGERIAQLVIVPCLLPKLEDFELVDELEETERGDGGFGSTGR